MHKSILIVVLFVCLSENSFVQTEKGQTDPDSLWQVVTDKLQANKNNSNFFVLVGNESGIVYMMQKGNINGSSSFGVASSAKWVSSTVIHRLIEEGILSYSTRPQDIIPWWTNDTSDPRSRITVSHLLSFQSGLNNEQDCLSDQQFTIGNHMQVLGYMAQAKTGITWRNLYTTYVGTPLGMQSFYPGVNNPRVAGGFYSNAYDYEKLLRALYLKTILLPETISEMEKDRTNGSTIAYSPLFRFSAEWHYAFGSWVECDSNPFVAECNTENFYIRSSGGAEGFYPWIDRTNNYYGIFSTVGSSGGVSATIVDSVRDDITAAVNAARTDPVSEPSPLNGPISNNNHVPMNTDGRLSESGTAILMGVPTLFCSFLLVSLI